jgi:hypothetical protein
MDSELIKILTPHKEFLSTTTKWDDYAKEHELPSSANLIYQFGTWNQLKKLLGLTTQNQSYSLKELEEIALKHKEKFTTIKEWDTHVKEQSLPSAMTYIKAFESWRKAQSTFGITNEKKRKDKYSKDEIRTILIEQSQNFTNRKQWDEYAKEHKLPTFKTIKKYYSYDEILELVGKNKTFNLTTDDLAKIAWKHKGEFFSMSMSEWNTFASDNDLPSSDSFSRHFGSWKKARHDIVVLKG